MKTLRDLKIGETCVVSEVGGTGALRQHFLDMGLLPGTEVTLVKYAPMGDPMQLNVHGYELTLRLDDAAQIGVRPIPKVNPEKHIPTIRELIDTHPGLGEGGIYHDKNSEHPLPEEEILTFALAGNQNCGKTTLFNQLTGANQHVGNFPGVTVDRKDGVIRGHANTLVTDLPGIYSMSPYSSEELVTRNFILDEKPKGIINIVDASNIERNLYLTMQLLELNIPMVVALNMMDEVRENGGTIRINEMEQLLGVPVVPISAVKDEGIDELIDHAIHVTKFQERPQAQDFCSADEDGGAIHRCLHAVMHMIDDHCQRTGVPVRFAASKIVEGDQLIIDKLDLDENEKDAIEHIVVQMEEERHLDRSAAIAHMRYDYILDVCSATVVKAHESKEHARSRKMDEILTGRHTAIPIFAVIMALIFYLTFNVLGKFLQDLIQAGVDQLSAVTETAMENAHVNATLISLVRDGIFGGVGTVLSFLPLVVILFFFLSILEDTGYMARVAFVMDKLLRKIGLSGRSIVPMLVGFGCSVPSVMASRTLPSERDRKMTILMTPFMSCTAKVPIYGFFSAAFFPDHAALVMVLLYALGVVLGVAFAAISNKTAFKGEAVPFVMELPNYRMPGVKSVGMLIWDKTKDFLERAFTIIFAATLIIWFLQTFNFHMNVAADPQDSMLAMIAGWIAPIFSPLGFGDWKVVSSLITGFMAKESVVATLHLLVGGAAKVTAEISTAGGAALLVFCLLYTPCVAAVTAIRRELGTRWMFFVIFFQCGIAWVMGWIVYLIGSLIF